MDRIVDDSLASDRAADLEASLNDFDPALRRESLGALLASVRGRGTTLSPVGALVNMHCHSFYSYNAFGHSPTSLAWLAKKLGLYAVGIVDFDVLDGVDEFLDACERAAVRGTAGIETRVFVADYKDRQINSPGEPGVCYHMGVGFASASVPTRAREALSDLGRRAEQRNRAILSRINAFLEPVSVDYERDVLPLTPGGHPTERHLVAAYIEAARRLQPDPEQFWVQALDLDPAQATDILANGTEFQNLVRAKLMKRGGVGYVQPHSGMFPSLEAFHELVLACGALPCAAWLDGTSEVEQEAETWLKYLIGKGVVVLNIIPDRNWNIPDPVLRRTKVRNLRQIVDLSQELHLPLNIGTEMNSFGQKFVDDLDVPELAPLREAFVDGAHFVYGHTVLQRAAGLGYQSEWARRHLPGRKERNRFFTRLGQVVPPGPTGIELTKNLSLAVTPDELLSVLTSNEVPINA